MNPVISSKYVVVNPDIPINAEPQKERETYYKLRRNQSSEWLLRQ